MIIAEGFEILIVWESDYNNNKKETVEKCLKFLNLGDADGN